MQEIAPSDKPRLLLPSFQGYQRSWLMRDLLAGVTIGAIAIPGQIAVAKVAGMPPTTGLWACVAAGIFAALFVANRVLWIGSDSTTSPLIFAGLSVDDTAETLGVSPRQVDRLWAYGRAWLAREVPPME